MKFNFTYGMKVRVKDPESFYDGATGVVINFGTTGTESNRNIVPRTYTVALSNGREFAFPEYNLERVIIKAPRSRL